MSQIIRTEHNRSNPYAQISKKCLEDNSLSWKAKGVLCYLLSRPDNWQTYPDQLATVSTDQEHSTRSAIKELIKAGYIKRSRLQCEADGRFQGFEYVITEDPYMGNPYTDYPYTEDPYMGNPYTDYPYTESPSVESPSVENQTLIKHIDNKKDLQQEKSKTNTIAPKTDFELFRVAYNQHKPDRWPALKTVNESRKKIFLGWVKEHGGLNEAIAVLIDALKFARSDPWWNDKDITIENFAAKGRMTQFYERYMNQSRGVPSAPQHIPTLPQVSETARNKLRSYQ
jgi:hypothetical protein